MPRHSKVIWRHVKACQDTTMVYGDMRWNAMTLLCYMETCNWLPQHYYGIWRHAIECHDTCYIYSHEIECHDNTILYGDMRWNAITLFCYLKTCDRKP